MRDDRIHGAALIAGAVAFLATAGLHPSGSQLLASPAAFASHAPINVLAHSLALFGMWFTLFGVVGLARRLGWQRPDVTAAFVAFALGAAMISLAAIVDGLVSTRFAADYVASDDDALRGAIRGYMRFCYYLASSLSRYYVTAAAIAILLWSWAAWRTRFARVLPWLGAILGVIALIAQLRGYLRMNIHDVMVLAVGQGIWMAWAGIALWRRRADGALQSAA
jgi:hypothetical protein